MKRLHLLVAAALIPLTFALGQSLFSAMEVQAQNTQCSDRTLGDSTNACANTRFATGSVASAISGGGGIAPSAIATGGGVPTNVRSAYTTTNSMATSDCGKTIALGGSAFYNFIVPTATTFNSVCEVVVTNEDSICPNGGAATCRGKSLSINGYTPFILWPGQTLNLLRQANAWQFTQPGRWIVQALPQFNVNHASGGNPLASTPTSDCLGSGAGACNTIQNCVLIIEGMIDNNGFGPTCKNVAETFTENNVAHTHPIIGFHVISITGDTTTPANVVWQVSGVGNTAYQGRDTGMAILQGFKFVSTGTGNNFIQAGQSGIADFGSIEFGANPGGYDIFITPAGVANWFGGTLSITGDMAGFVLSTGEGHVLLDGATISIPNSRTWTNFFQLSGPFVLSGTGMTFTGTGAGSGSSGRQWLIDRFTNLNVTGSTIPGNSLGLYNCQPLVSLFTAGTNAVFTATTCNGLYPLSVELDMWGGGGGGAGNGATPTAAGAGTITCWNSVSPACSSPQFSAQGGAAGAIGAATGVGAAGGTGVTCDINEVGGSGGPGENVGSRAGGKGGESTLGGAGPPGILLPVAGITATAFSGSGGSGASTGAAPANSGGGGAAGGHCFKLLTNPAPSASFYTVGTGGLGGTGTLKGGDGAAGKVKVIQRW